MKIKTSELIGPALDWAVAKCEGWKNLRWHTYKCLDPMPPVLVMDHNEGWLELSALNYSTDWAQGGPIIEREGITTRRVHDGTWRAEFSEAMLKSDGSAYAYLNSKGPTPRVAAMRCYVTSRLGDEVDIPEELCE